MDKCIVHMIYYTTYASLDRPVCRNNKNYELKKEVGIVIKSKETSSKFEIAIYHTYSMPLQVVTIVCKDQ